MSEVRYRLAAYVCEGGVVYHKNNLGAGDFAEIYNTNPDGCRYAVVKVLDEVRAYDMDSCTFDNRFRASPGKFRVFQTVEAALMGCALIDHTK